LKIFSLDKFFGKIKIIIMRQKRIISTKEAIAKTKVILPLVYVFWKLWGQERKRR